MDKEIKILFLAANPLDTTRLRLDEEIRSIEQALQLSNFSKKFDIKQHWAVRVSDIQALLMRYQPDFVHFSGHGSSQSEIIFEDISGNSHPVSPRSLSKLFSILKGNVKCVVLNACFTSKQAHAISNHIEYVIGMPHTIKDRTAISFATAFYQAIGFGKDIKTAYDLGCLQIDLENLNEQDAPKLFAKIKPYNLVQNDKMEKLRELLLSKSYTDVLDNIYEWIINDQIEVSGGWGKSQYNVMKRITNEEMSVLEKREGGIITTFIALRSLMFFEGSKHDFRQKEYSQKACQYFLKRQTRKGGFGRFVDSLSGIEIHPSLRHTAFAISSMIDLNGPPEAIYNGIKYLSHNWSLRDVHDDAAPSLAIAGIVYAYDKFITTTPCFQLLTDKEKGDINLTDWPHSRKLLIRELADLAHTSRFSPIFSPYGQYDAMLFDTAITTVDLISNPLPESLVPTVVDILSIIVKHRIDGGIPYNQAERFPDIGLSAYLLALIVRPGFLESLKNVKFASELAQFGLDIAHFIINNYQNPEFKAYTYCDTFSNLLLTKFHSDIEL